jgi:hypothetical protein
VNWRRDRADDIVTERKMECGCTSLIQNRMNPYWQNLGRVLLRYGPFGGFDYPHARLLGNWTYWSFDGRKLGENQLSMGKGHFRVWDSNGVVRAEGEIDKGTLDGKWVQYDASGRVMGSQIFNAGVHGAYSPDPKPWQ